jgi:uncharacterized protein YxjI
MSSKIDRFESNRSMYCFGTHFRRKMNLIGGKKFKVKSKLGEFTIEGNFRSREFKIKLNHHLVGTISKKFFSIGDTYGVKIEQGQDIPFILALAIVVDEVAHG